MEDLTRENEGTKKVPFMTYSIDSLKLALCTCIQQESNGPFDVESIIKDL